MSKNKYYWLSFCDNDKPKGEKFLGVIITVASSPTKAMENTHRLGINPGGEIQFHEMETGFISLEYLNILMTAEDLKKKGLVD